MLEMPTKTHRLLLKRSENISAQEPRLASRTTAPMR
jgi:hypothetical protein